MRPVLDVAQVRAADAAAVAAVGEAVLIERAATAAAHHAVGWLAELRGGVYGARVVVLAGAGHNGADALRAGALLARAGAAVTALATSPRPGDAHVAAAWAALQAAGGHRVRELPPEDRVELVLDGITGVGSRGGLTGAAAALVGALPTGTPVLAVDLPSGVETDTGAVPGIAVRAGRTVTFGGLKPALVVGAAAELAGLIEVVDVGWQLAPSTLGILTADDVAALLTDPPPTADKYSRGVVGVCAGGDRYPGAAVLATGGAVRAGAGYVRYLTPGAAPGAAPGAGGSAAAAAVVAAWPTVVAGEGRVDAWACGPGLDADAGLAAARAVVASDTAAVLDAGALAVGAAALRARGERGVPTVITPHAGEFERLTGVDPRPDPLGSARRAAADLGVHVLLKGQRTVVAAPDGAARINPTGTSWLSTAGTGDVLAGAMGALLAAEVKRAAATGRGPDVLTVAAAAAFLHGLAGRYCRVPLNAADLLGEWATAVAVSRGGQPR